MKNTLWISQKINLIITLPCHNEARFLQNAVSLVKNKACELSKDFTIVIAEDGSTDGSSEMAKELATHDPDVMTIHSDTRLGRGRALRHAWFKIHGDIYVYLDVDMATDMKYFPQLVNAIVDGYDLATGSRYVKGSRVERPFLRRFVSITYNWMIRILFRDGVHDHQCGFKAFSKRLINDVLYKSQSNHWFWDTEIIVLAKRRGYRLLEFPVEWVEKRRSKTSVGRIIGDIVTHGTGILKLLSWRPKYDG